MMTIKDETYNPLDDFEQPKECKLVKSILLDNSDKDAWLQLASIYFQEEEYLKALSCYMRILSLEPRNPLIWNKLAVTFMKLNEKKSAIEMSRVAFRLADEQAMKQSKQS